MRLLEFTVKKQRLIKKATCDFSGLVAGSKGYLYAKFDFPYGDWRVCPIRIASFWIGNKEYAKLLDENDMCEIPSEVLAGEEFRVYLIGADRDYRIDTNEVRIQQEVK